MSDTNIAPPPQDTRMPSDGDDNTGKVSRISLRNVAWPLLLSLLVLLLIAYFTFDAGSFRQMLSTLRPTFLVAAIATVVLRVAFGAWRFQHTARGSLTFMQSLRGQLSWDFFSNVTPSALGGGPFAAVYMARDSQNKVGETTALVLYTMLLDQLWSALMIPLILFSTLYFAVIPESVGSVGALAFVGYFLTMMTWVSLFGYATLFRPELLQRISDRIFRLRFLQRFRPVVAREMEQMGGFARILRSQPASFFGASFVLTAGTWLPRYLLPVFIVLSVFPDLDSFLFFIRGITMMVSAMIIPTPGGAGGIEGLYALFMGPLMPKALVAPTLFLWRFLGYYIFLGLGAFIFKKKRTEPLAASAAAATDDAIRRPDPATPSHEPEFADTQEQA
ncbi:MAG: lysylphosphatidylglycerol synthase transmembrane domain-containing protein [Rhodothermales bacterium]|nr:lysylphosphatidylglycerol synthase transmembrane domain-containing protein [Rhodothermales bacterium]